MTYLEIEISTYGWYELHNFFGNRLNLINQLQYGVEGGLVKELTYTLEGCGRIFKLRERSLSDDTRSRKQYYFLAGKE